MPWTNIGARVSSGEQTRLWCCLEEGGGTRVSLWSHEMGLAVWAGLPRGLCCLRHPGDLKPGHFRSSYQFPVAAAIYNQQLGCLKFKSKYFFSLSLEVRRLRVRFRRSIPSGIRGGSVPRCVLASGSRGRSLASLGFQMGHSNLCLHLTALSYDCVSVSVSCEDTLPECRSTSNPV